jgi:hypothetical protein
MNKTLVQTPLQGEMTVAPLLKDRLNKIISRADLAILTDLEARSDALWKEKSEFCRGPKLMAEARAVLMRDPTAANREKVDAIEEKFRSDDYCSQEEDLRYSQLNQIEAQVPAAVYPVLRRVETVLAEVLEEEYAAARKMFGRLGVQYDPAVHSSGDEILNFIKITIHRLGESIARIRRKQAICADYPSAVLENYLDLSAVKKDTLAATLPVPLEESEPVTAPREQAFRDNIDAPVIQIDRGTGKPVKRDLPGVDFLQYGAVADAEQISSDGEFSKELGRIAALPSKRV